MKYKLEFTEKAKSDLRDIIEYYENNQPGLGKEFYEEVKEKNKDIKNKPDKYSEDSDGIRSTKVKRFPYYIYYILKAPLILIIAIWHTARLPFSKKERKE